MTRLRIVLMYLMPFAGGAFVYALIRSVPWSAAATVFLLARVLYLRGLYWAGVWLDWQEGSGS